MITGAEQRRFTISLTAEYRDIWEALQFKPAIERVLTPDANLLLRLLTREQMEFVNVCLPHLDSWHQAIKEREVRI